MKTKTLNVSELAADLGARGRTLRMLNAAVTACGCTLHLIPGEVWALVSRVEGGPMEQLAFLDWAEFPASRKLVSDAIVLIWAADPRGRRVVGDLCDLFSTEKRAAARARLRAELAGGAAT